MGRRLLASALVGAGLLAAVVAQAGLWARRDLLESRRFGAHARAALRFGEVQDVLARELTDQIQLRAPAPARALRPQVEASIRTVLASPEFGAVFEQAVLRLHRAVLHGEGDRLTLDLTPAEQLIVRAATSSVPALGRVVHPGDVGTVDLGEARQVGTLRRLAADARLTGPVALALALALLAAAVAVSPTPPRMLERVGVGLVAGAAVLLVALLVAPGIGLARVADPQVRDAGERVAGELLTGMYGQTAGAAAVGVVLAGLGLAWARRTRQAVPA